jgi:hypothetical protein
MRDCHANGTEVIAESLHDLQLKAKLKAGSITEEEVGLSDLELDFDLLTGVLRTHT